MNEDRVFRWLSYNIAGLLPKDWDKQIVDIANVHSKQKIIRPTSVTSREHSTELQLPVETVGGQKVRAELPWLFDLYEGLFKDLAQNFTSEPVSLASQDMYAININVQRGREMRYEAHVDSNPVEGLLYVTSHLPGEGGELVVSNAGNIHGIEAIRSDCTRIYPSAGQLIFFNASEHSHFVEPLAAEDDVRLVVAMNFYTPSRPESSRPKDLDAHLGLIGG